VRQAGRTRCFGPSGATRSHGAGALVDLIATKARRLGRSERRWDHAHPALNVQLPKSDRLHALMAVSGRPCVTIRRHDFEISRLDQLVERDLCDRSIADSCPPRCRHAAT
jgi:Flp pilus assembly CpaF family ATPase